MAKPSPIDGLSDATPVEIAGRRAVAVRLNDVRHYEPLLAHERDPDCVHDMRVATRRLRAALRLFDKGGTLTEAHDHVKRLGDALGVVRELHVQLGWLDGALRSRANDAPERPGIQTLMEERRIELPAAEEGLRGALARWQDGLAEAIAETASRIDGRGRLGGRRMRKRLCDRMAQARNRLQAAIDSTDAHTAHRLRITAKKLRYDCELLQPAFPDALDPFIKQLVPLQELLGDLHDADVHLPIIERFLVRAEPAQQAGGLALLRDELARRDRLAGELGVELRHWQRDEILEELHEQLC
jgi:CHAD domain-containing protein